ncbi:MAG TPA: serine/threonine-protein kinase, partial [Gemmatimonadales bacterium]
MTIRDSLQRTLGAAFVIERELTGGGMAHLYVAQDTALDRPVVVKVLPPERSEGVSAERFRGEIRTVAALQHPNIVGILAAGEVEGLPYYIMPYIEGESLRALLERSGVIAPRAAVAILRDVARACAYAHERGIVHRDIKPDTVLLSGGAAMITDFGVAKALSAAQRPTQGSGGTLTRDGFT